MGTNGIASLSVAMSQQNVGQQASLAVMKMAMDNVEQNGDMMVQNLASLQHAAQPNLGANIDILA